MARAMRRAHDHSVHGADRSIPTIGEPMKIQLEHSLYGLLAVGLASMPAAATSPNTQQATHHATHHDQTTGMVRTVRKAPRRYLSVSMDDDGGNGGSLGFTSGPDTGSDGNAARWEERGYDGVNA